MHLQYLLEQLLQIIHIDVLLAGVATQQPEGSPVGTLVLSLLPQLPALQKLGSGEFFGLGVAGAADDEEFGEVVGESENILQDLFGEIVGYIPCFVADHRVQGSDE